MKKSKLICIKLSLILLIPISIFSQNIPIGSPINGAGSNEFNPCISGNGRTLIFEQLYANESKPIVVISYQKNGGWVKPEELRGANTTIPTITNGGFFLNSNGNSVLFHSPISGGVGGNDIWMMEKTIIGTWAPPKNLASPVNSALHETDPSISPDGKYLFFTRLINEKTPGGTPCGKIFVAEKSGKDAWKKPVMLPAPINISCECAGRMLSDNKTFIFASMRDGGIGGYDIYKTVQHDDGSWEEPVPYTFVNTTKDDKYVSIAAAGGLLYYSGPDKTGGLDILRTKIPDNMQPDKVTLIQGNVKNASNNLALVPKVVVTNTQNNKSVTYMGAADGSYTAIVPQDNIYDVAIMAYESGYSFKSLLFNPPKAGKYEEKIVDTKLAPCKPDVVFPLNNISFVNNTDSLENFSNTEIYRLYIMLKAHITTRIEIGVHTNEIRKDTTFQPGLTARIIDTLGTYTDTSGREQYKLRTTYSSDNTLAQAKMIANILIKKGIPVERVIPKGYGTSQPLNPAPSDAILNKRVELKIIHE
jgi:outer membrane protein OmpA-like peptidoglycan-associated protein